MNESLRPDEVIPPEGKPSLQLRVFTRDLVQFLPNLVKLLSRLVMDPRVPRRSKVLLVALVAYLASPIDFVPDAIPVVGMVDDVLLAAYAVNHLIARAGEDVVLEHWDGPQDLLEMVRSVLDASSSLVPPPLRKWIDRFSG
ncbi:MAG TPA: DUF1232 domain-containing protein [Acidimicrobiia bacterium]|nr:DUF1232 domain-containing protein [Acidimicrobiia bacterium]